MELHPNLVVIAIFVFVAVYTAVSDFMKGE